MSLSDQAQTAFQFLYVGASVFSNFQTVYSDFKQFILIICIMTSIKLFFFVTLINSGSHLCIIFVALELPCLESAQMSKNSRISHA